MPPRSRPSRELIKTSSDAQPLVRDAHRQSAGAHRLPALVLLRGTHLSDNRTRDRRLRRWVASAPNGSSGASGFERCPYGAYEHNHHLARFVERIAPCMARAVLDHSVAWPELDRGTIVELEDDAA